MNPGSSVNTRIDAFLDGELPREALTVEELAAADSIREAAAMLRAELPSAPAQLDLAVLRRIRELGLEPACAADRAAAGKFDAAAAVASGAAGASGAARASGAVPAPVPDAASIASTRPSGSSAIRALVGSWWRPRQISFSLRPAYAAGLAIVAVALMAVAQATRTDETLQAAAAPPVFVQFRLDAEGASNVMLAGSFTEWQPAYELVETAPGVWTVLVALQPGVHDYAFIIDGESWVADPAAPSVDDGFGGSNSRLALLPAL
jgi:hypothetical protein